MAARLPPTESGRQMSLEIKEIIAEREIERYQLHSSHLNEQMVHVLKTIGFDKRYQRGVGQYLYDEHEAKYLDLLSGWGVFAIGRNHPTVREALKAVLDSELPNLVQMGVSVLSGVLAERLLEFVPHLDKVFFSNSGTEAVGNQICPRHDPPSGDRILQSRLSRPELWLAVVERRPEFPGGFRSSSS